MAKPRSKPRALPKFVTFVGTPNTLTRKEHATPTPAKGHLVTALKERLAWAEIYSHATLNQLRPIMNEVQNLNLPDAKSGRQWEWRATDDVSQMTFVYRIEVL
jgi:hypothetical protein